MSLIKLRLDISNLLSTKKKTLAQKRRGFLFRTKHQTQFECVSEEIKNPDS
jgi:hypothetical protein